MASAIVVGVDFGTTYSGVSWAVDGGNKTIRLINDWPDPRGATANSEKVPTALSYADGDVKHWGFAAARSGLCWFKLLLEPQSKHAKEAAKLSDTEKLIKQMGKSYEQVAADYIRKLWEYAMKDIEKIKGANWETSYAVRCVLTVPAIWSDAAKDRTRTVARMAGLPEDIRILEEPEAAARAVLNDRNEEEQTLKIGDCFVVCDAGGGTVDLISYEICGLNPLQVKECAGGSGGLCGSVFIDDAFEKCIKTLVGEQEYESIKVERRLKMMEKFETSVKRHYSGDEDIFSVDLLGISDNPSEGIEDCTITLKPTLLKTVFDRIIGKVLDLVNEQIEEAYVRGKHIKAVLLVGGFGNNRYMYKKLREFYDETEMQVLQSNGGWSVICRGATMWGLDNPRNKTTKTKWVLSRIARFNYGLCYNIPFNEGAGHLKRDRIRSPNGNLLAKNQMIWLIRKGQVIEEGRTLNPELRRPIQASFFGTGTREFSDTLYYCEDDKPPTRFEDGVKKLCTVSYGIDYSLLWLEETFRDSQTNEKWRWANFQLRIHFNAANLEFSVFYKNEPVAYTTAQYRESFECDSSEDLGTRLRSLDVSKASLQNKSGSLSCL